MQVYCIGVFVCVCVFVCVFVCVRESERVCICLYVYTHTHTHTHTHTYIQYTCIVAWPYRMAGQQTSVVSHLYLSCISVVSQYRASHSWRIKKKHTRTRGLRYRIAR
jgi:hypothetical protein